MLIVELHTHIVSRSFVDVQGPVVHNWYPSTKTTRTFVSSFSSCTRTHSSSYIHTHFTIAQMYTFVHSCLQARMRFALKSISTWLDTFAQLHMNALSALVLDPVLVCNCSLLSVLRLICLVTQWRSFHSSLCIHGFCRSYISGRTAPFLVHLENVQGWVARVGASGSHFRDRCARIGVAVR